MFGSGCFRDCYRLCGRWIFGWSRGIFVLALDRGEPVLGGGNGVDIWFGQNDGALRPCKNSFPNAACKSSFLTFVIIVGFGVITGLGYMGNGIGILEFLIFASVPFGRCFGTTCLLINAANQSDVCWTALSRVARFTAVPTPFESRINWWWRS